MCGGVISTSDGPVQFNLHQRSDRYDDVTEGGGESDSMDHGWTQRVDVVDTARRVEGHLDALVPPAQAREKDDRLGGCTVGVWRQQHE